MTDLLPPSPAFTLYAALYRAGHSIRLADGKLMVRDADRLTDGQRQAIKFNRAALIDLLTPSLVPGLTLVAP